MLRNLLRFLPLVSLVVAASIHAQDTNLNPTAKPQPRLSAQDSYVRNALVKQGEQKGLDKSPQFRLLMSQFRKEQLARLALEHAAGERLPDFTARAQEVYQARLSKDFTLPLRLRARVLLLRIADGQQAATVQQLQGIRAEILAGKLDFKQAVMTYSQAADKHFTQGDTQWFHKGQVSPAIYDAVLRLNPAQALSDVLVDQQTAYLIQFMDRQEARTIPFAEAKAALVNELQQGYREEQQQALLQQLKTEFQTQAQTQAATDPQAAGGM